MEQIQKHPNEISLPHTPFFLLRNLADFFFYPMYMCFIHRTLHHFQGHFQISFWLHITAIGVLIFWSSFRDPKVFSSEANFDFSIPCRELSKVWEFYFFPRRILFRLALNFLRSWEVVNWKGKGEKQNLDIFKNGNYRSACWACREQFILFNPSLAAKCFSFP